MFFFRLGKKSLYPKRDAAYFGTGEKLRGLRPSVHITYSGFS